MSNGRCRMHGGASTGPATVEGRKRIAQARTVHGRRSAEQIALRREIAKAGRDLRELNKVSQAMLRNAGW